LNDTSFASEVIQHDTNKFQLEFMLSFIVCPVLEERMNFVTVDEVGEEEEEEEEVKEAVKTKTKGRAKKRTRQTPGETHM